MKYTIAEHEQQIKDLTIDPNTLGIDISMYADLLAEVKRIHACVGEWVSARLAVEACLADAIGVLKTLCDRPDYCREWWGYRAQQCLSRIDKRRRSEQRLVQTYSN